MKKKLFLVIDGNALLHRAWHAIPPLTSPDGIVVNAVYGFSNILEKMIAEYSPDYMAVAWDLPGKTFRHKKFEAYKATRKKKEEELYIQIPLIQEILTAHGIPSLSVEGLEADDVIGTLAKTYGPKKETEVLIVTGDMDALQLVDKDVKVLSFVKGVSETKLYDEKAVKERYELNPKQVIDLKALMGDSSDNIPGIEGVGKKGATTLLKKYKDISGIIKALKEDKIESRYKERLEGQEKRMREMEELVTIVTDAPLKDFSIKDAEFGEQNEEEILRLYREFGFRRLVQKYEGAAPVQSAVQVDIEEAKMQELSKKQLTIVVRSGAQSLFDSNISQIALFDGSEIFITQNPDKNELQDILSFINSVQLVIGHDLKQAMHGIGEITAPVFDAKVGTYLLDPGSRNFDLKSIAQRYLGKRIKEDGDIRKEASIILSLYQVLEAGLKKEGMTKLSEEIEMPLIRILYKMEKTGILIDSNRLKIMSKKFEKELKSLTSIIYKLAGAGFNINSPSQLADVLFDKMDLPTKGIKKTKTSYSTAASELEKLWDEHEIIPLISKYREYAKLKSTYIDALPELIASDGRIHTTFNQTVTATGRLSSSDPNLQNIPIRSDFGKEIRKAFVAPKGYQILAIDYSQFELRLAASMAKDKEFIKAFKEGADIHRTVAAEVLGKDPKDITTDERRAAKAINFGILYGMGVRNLARSTGLGKEQAKEFIDTYFALHPGITDYIEMQKAKVKQDGFVETLYGRRRYLPDIHSGVQMVRAAAERMAVNMPIQGTQADLVKIAMIRVNEWIEKENQPVKMLLQVHDELVFELPSENSEKLSKEIAAIMESVWKDDVPLVADADIGPSWGEMKSV